CVVVSSPRSLSDDASVRRPSDRTSTITTDAPSSANRSATALPMPWAAPVTTATLPSSWLCVRARDGTVRLPNCAGQPSDRTGQCEQYHAGADRCHGDEAEQ